MSGSIWQIQSLVLVGQHIHFVCRMRIFFCVFQAFVAQILCFVYILFVSIHILRVEAEVPFLLKSPPLLVATAFFVGCSSDFVGCLTFPSFPENLAAGHPHPSDPNGRDDCGLEHLHLPTPDFFAPKQEDIQALASRRGNLRWQWSSWSYQGPVDGEFISGDGPSLSSSICSSLCIL